MERERAKVRTSNDDEREQSLNFGLRLSGKSSSFDTYRPSESVYNRKETTKRLTVHQPRSNLLRITQLLQETSILLHSLNPESLILCSNSVDEVVVLELSSRNLSLDLRIIYDQIVSENWPEKCDYDAPMNLRTFPSTSTLVTSPS